ncbi:MAG: GAF domain-containing protein [Bacteroidales bacterium]|jgi:GAF domain-containing protein|nr:GAF domain-containing protein [Bacteroidales bacterium]
MAEDFKVAQGSKADMYADLFEQAKSIVSTESDVVANMGNVVAMLHFTFGFWWTGFYRVVDNELVLGPFQGPLACTRIANGRGVCGTAWNESKTIVVPDVDKFPGHIACSSESKSEIVVPIIVDGVVRAVLDIDSAQLATFDEVDKIWLERLVASIAERLVEK